MKIPKTFKKKQNAYHQIPNVNNKTIVVPSPTATPTGAA